jgi:CSLREA domain-containing protein
MMLSYSAFKWTARLLGGVAAMGAFALAAGTANAGTITVTTDLDGFNDGDGKCSLREAIQAANTNAPFDACPAGDGADTIVFDTTAMGGNVITLTITTPSLGGNDDNEYRDLDVVVDQALSDTSVFTLTIDGGSGVTVQGDPTNWPDRVFDILTPTVPGAVAGGVLLKNLYIKFGGPISPNFETYLLSVCRLGGGGVRHRSGGLLEITGGTVERNRVNANGGGICQDGGQLRLVSYPYIATNQALFDGGGIYISGTADIVATVAQNNASLDGGGVYVRAGSLVTVTNSNVSDNGASDGSGGGFWNAGALTFSGGNVTNNQAPVSVGGGVYNAAGGVVNASFVTINDNDARDGAGLYNLGTATLDATVQSNIAADNGGGIWNAGALTINGGSYNANQAQNGGGIYNASNGSVTLTNAGVSSNIASANGGGVYNLGAVSISSAGVGPNNGANNGGGIWNNGVLTITSAGVTTNTASADGGGIYNASNGTATLTTAGVSDNQAPNGSGGGIYNDGTLNVTSSGVDANQAAFGGGIYNGLGGATASLTSAQVNGNSATQQGGGIFNNGTLDVNGARVNNNSAGQAGGGIYNQNGTAVIFNFSQVNGNVINQTGFLSAQGGGIWNGATLVITSSSVNSNTAAAVNNLGFANAAGGGIYNQSATTLHITGTQANSNTVTAAGFSGANAQGGGVHNGFNSAIYITNSSVVANAAVAAGGVGSGQAQGGGVSNNNGAVAIARSTINNNSAAGSGSSSFASGGGVFSDAPAPNALTIEDSQVNNNVASGGLAQGGGVHNLSGGAEMRRGTIAGNVVSATNNAQGGGAFNGGALLITATLVAQNTATATQQAQGGGAFNAASGVLTVTFSTLEQNQARGGSAGQGGGAFSSGTMRIEGSTVQANTATSDGGGVYRFNGLVDIVASTLAANQAISDGGGLYNNASVPVGGMVVQHSAVVSNTAQRGGSAYNLAGLLLMRNSTVSGNSGNGAIYADDSDPGPASSSNTQLQFVTVASNTGSVGLNVATGANATAYATLLAYNSGGNCAGFAFPLFSLSSDASCLGMSMGNPLLKPLALNGGGTLNHALALGSPAIDKVPAAFCTVSRDQRYFSRPWFLTNACDIGAFELQPYYPVFVPIVFRP